MNSWPVIGDQISATTDNPFIIREAHAVGGGCINETVWITDGQQRYFVKLNVPDGIAMFEAEADGLMEIHRTQTIRVPLPICYGHDKKSAWLVLEYLHLRSGRPASSSKLGVQLAAMHRVTAPQFGWNRHNTIGQTPQINTYTTNWTDFWRTYRLGYQLDLAGKNGHLGKLQKLGEQLLVNLDSFLAGATPRPSLLHGDLWSGNHAFDNGGKPVLFDPAVYYGDRETDIAMTELFGGFSSDFYSAYQHEYPLDSGYNVRKLIYNLYHILNHLNLFGSSYRQQAEHILGTLLAEIH